MEEGGSCFSLGIAMNRAVVRVTVRDTLRVTAKGVVKVDFRFKIGLI